MHLAVDENLGAYLLFLFWWASLLLIGKIANLIDSSFILWCWVFNHGWNPLTLAGKIALLMIASERAKLVTTPPSIEP